MTPPVFDARLRKGGALRRPRLRYLPNGVNTPLGVHATTVGHAPRVGQTKVAHGVLIVFGGQNA
jgi:hypothetical protein